MPQEANRTARIEARIAPEALAIVKQAADLQGRSLSDFIVAAAHDAAQKAIEDTHIIRLAAEDQRRVFDLLSDPPPLNAAMERARTAHARLFRP